MILLRDKVEAITFIYSTGISIIHTNISRELSLKDSSYDIDVKLNVDDDIFKIISNITV